MHKLFYRYKQQIHLWVYKSLQVTTFKTPPLSNNMMSKKQKKPAEEGGEKKEHKKNYDRVTRVTWQAKILPRTAHAHTVRRRNFII